MFVLLWKANVFFGAWCTSLGTEKQHTPINFDRVGETGQRNACLPNMIHRPALDVLLFS